MNSLNPKYQEWLLAQATRPVWFDCSGNLRIGHSSDMVEYLEAIGVKTRA